MVSQMENLFLMAFSLQPRAIICINNSYRWWWCRNKGTAKIHLLFCEFVEGQFTKFVVYSFKVASELLGFVLFFLGKNECYSFPIAPLKIY